MNIQQIHTINTIHRNIENNPGATTRAEDELIEYLRSIEVDQPLTTQHEQQLSDLFNKTTYRNI